MGKTDTTMSEEKKQRLKYQKKKKNYHEAKKSQYDNE